MLLPTQRQGYQEFQEVLEKTYQTATATDMEVAKLRQNFQDLQQLFQSKIATLSANDFESDSAYRWQSLQTEIYKQMRLLETDMLRLQASRSAATTLARTSGISARLSTLMQYCQALLQL